MILVGGLGGGGDSGGALAIALALRRHANVAILGAVPCRSSDLVRAKRVAGSVFEVTPRTWVSGRFFESRIASLGWEVYVACMEDGLEGAVEGLETLISQRRVDAIVGVDLGGDALLRGDEPELGSAAEDAMGLALLSEVSRELGVKVLVAVGALGAEMGGVLDMGLLVENMVRLERASGYLGAYRPRGEVLREFTDSARRLLEEVPSFMLTVFLDALLGNLGERRYRVAYFDGTFRVEPHHAYLYVFEADKVCEASELCQEAIRRKILSLLRRALEGRKSRSGRSGIEGWRKELSRLSARKLSLSKLLGR
ncbi:MAG TPA: DUF1152 domain-containing protein [Candidatus Korarchaeota archaeon]|nr:DUF1152 domain-containing protein [Candidatus Korarchaeota archaeon]